MRIRWFTYDDKKEKDESWECHFEISYDVTYGATREECIQKMKEKVDALLVELQKFNFEKENI